MASPTLGAWTQLTITLDGLANNAAQQSAAVDLSSGGQPHEIQIGGSFKTATGTLSTTTPYVSLYAAAKTDGTNYAGGASGSNAAYTVPTEWQPVFVGNVRLDAANTTLYFRPRGLAGLFGGQIPSEIVLIAYNVCGLALNASGGGALWYRKITF